MLFHNPVPGGLLQFGCSFRLPMDTIAVRKTSILDYMSLSKIQLLSPAPS